MKRLGVVLGSGAARGWAHIGVLKVLKQEGITVSAVSGCSIGSFVGAALAAGKLEVLHDWVLKLDPWQIIRLLDLGWNKGGVIAGERLFSALDDMLESKQIEHLAMPYAAVATRIHDGREHIFTQGNLLEAVRASCAMPGFLPPQRIGKHWYTDGGVVNPVPVSVMQQQHHVDITLAVNLNAPSSVSYSVNEPSLPAVPNWLRYLGIKQAPVNEESLGVTEVMARAIDIMQDRITRARLAGDPPDVLVEPELANIGILEFHRAKEAIAAGEEAIQVHLPRLKRLLQL